MNPATHKRYLDYRSLFAYFGGKKTMLTAAEFTALDAEYAELHAKGESRDDEEEARFAEIANALFRD